MNRAHLFTTEIFPLCFKVCDLAGNEFAAPGGFGDLTYDFAKIVARDRLRAAGDLERNG